MPKTETAATTVEETETVQTGVDRAALKAIAKHFAKQIAVTAVVVVVTNVAVNLVLNKTRKTEIEA